MQFLFPGVLWGLLALSIPLIVHLFNFRRTRKVFFSNVALLKSVETKTSAFRKLKRWMVMAARMLFLAALVMAFAQPIISKNGQSATLENNGINGIYLDNSLSMQNVNDSKRFIDLAVIKIDELLSIFNRSSNVELLTNDFDGQDQFVMSAAKIKDRLTTVSFSETPRTFQQIYNRQRSVSQKHNASAKNHFFWYSDFQKSTLGSLKDLKIDSLDQLHLIPIIGKTSQNVFVDSVWLNIPVVREMQNNVLNVKVFNSGSKSVDKLPLKLYVDGVQSSTSSVNINPNGQAVAVFNFTIKGRGAHKARIEFDDQPITFDNTYYFVLNASPTIQILHLFGQRSIQNYVGKMYSNDSLFNYKSFSINNVDPGQIKNADFVVLEGINNIEGETKTAIEEYLRQGGSVALSPSENPSVSSYQAFLSQYGISNIESENISPNANEFIEINQPDKSSPFYEDVFEKGTFNGVVSLPKSQSKLSWSGVGERLLSFKNGRAFLTKTRVGDGNIYLLTSPLVPAYGNFAEHAFFVPTFYKMAYLSSKADRLAYNFNEPTLSFFTPDAPKNASYKLKNDKLEIIPIQRVQGKRLILELPKSSEINSDQIFGSGYYDLVIDGKAIKTLALNHDNKESKMETYTVDELKDIFRDQKNVNIYDNVMDAGFVDSFRDNTMAKPLWKYFIIAALIFLLIEISLIRFLKD